MSSPMELVHLAADSPLVSWRDRDLKFFQAPYMQQRPELEKGEGASFVWDLSAPGWSFPTPPQRMRLSR